MSYEILTAVYILIATTVYCMMEISERDDETNATIMFLLAGALWPLVTLVVITVFIPSQVHGYVINKRVKTSLSKKVAKALTEVYEKMPEEEYLTLDIETQFLIRSAVKTTAKENRDEQ